MTEDVRTSPGYDIVAMSRLLRPVLALGRHDVLRDLHHGLMAAGVVQAVARHDTPALFDWMLGLFQLQGISDANAFAFIARHGGVGWHDIANQLGPTASRPLSEPSGQPACARLRSHWHFEGCGFEKAAWRCAEPDLIDTCPLPRLGLRNGRLSQGAVAFFLFVRDICEGDLVDWIDRRLEDADAAFARHCPVERTFALREALLGPLSGIFGVGRKVLSMALADLLLAGDPKRERWVATGASMIAIDTLVHNFLYRTGTLRRFAAEHPYGARCYGPGGCAEIIENFARQIDAREFNPTFPAFFPRFVQHSIWRFCAADEWNICNGNQIDDRDRCRNRYCPAFQSCGRVQLR